MAQAQAQLSLFWKSFRNNVFDGLSSFQQRGEFVDMTLAADGHFVKVHQMILSLASPYLKELITSSAPCTHPVLFLNQVSYQTLCYILEYIYSGQVVVNKNDIKELLQAGKTLHIKGLEFMDWTNIQIVGAPGEQVTLKTDERTGISTPTEKISTTNKTESDQIRPDQTQKDKNNIPTLDNGSNKASQNSLESNTSQMEEDMDNSFQDSFYDYIEVENDSTKTNDDTNPCIQYTLSNQGNIQMILNRYLYNLRYIYKKSKPPARLWRCVEYVKNRCPASVTTRDDIVVQRVAAHKHSFHDKKILRKISSGIILSAIKDAEDRGRALKQNKDTSPTEDDTTNQIHITKFVSQQKRNDPLGQ